MGLTSASIGNSSLGQGLSLAANVLLGPAQSSRLTGSNPALQKPNGVHAGLPSDVRAAGRADFADVLLLHSLTQGAGLVGKTVLYNPTGTSQLKKGQVNSITVENGSIYLMVNGNKLALSQVRGIVAS